MQCCIDDHLVEARLVRPPQAVCVRVIREAEDRHGRESVGNLVRLDPRDVGDHEVRRVDAVTRDKVVAGQECLELAPEEEVDPHEQDRRHGVSLPRPG